MARYIDADEALRMMRNSKEDKPSMGDWDIAHDCCIDCVNGAPTADVVEVKRGQWIEHLENNYWHYDCPFCNDGYATKGKDKTPPNYCSNCGADMRGENDG